MSASTVLVTGGAGFIGSHVAARFARAGWRVRVLDDLSTGSRENCDPDWQLVVADVGDPAALRRAGDGCALVVHLAAFTSVPESFEAHEACTRTNVLGTVRVLEAARSVGAGRVVFASSSAVYAALPDTPKRESDCPEPISPYAVSKLEGEHLLRAWQELHGLPGVSLRFFNVYGPRQPADSAYAAVVPAFLERGLQGEALVIYGDGGQTRDFVYVGDVADAVLAAATSECTGVYNVGTGRELSVLELADTIASLTGSEPAHRFEPTRAGDVRTSTADVSRVVAELGWRPETGLEQGLGETLEWARKRLAGARDR